MKFSFANCNIFIIGWGQVPGRRDTATGHRDKGQRDKRTKRKGIWETKGNEKREKRIRVRDKRQNSGEKCM